MEARVLHTRFWTDEYINSLSIKERYFFLYLITNERVNIAGVYELPDIYIQAATSLKPAEIQKLKQKFQQDGKFIFYKSWVRIVNADKYQTYRGEKNDAAREKQLSIAPQEILDDNRVSIEYRYPSDTPNNQNQNKKSIINNQIEEKSKAFLEIWNKVHGTAYTAWKPIMKNLAYWLEQYQPEDIIQAVVNVRVDKWWKEHGSPVKFLRTRNKNGECDNIAELLHAHGRSENVPQEMIF